MFGSHGASVKLTPQPPGPTQDCAALDRVGQQPGWVLVINTWTRPFLLLTTIAMVAAVPPMAASGRDRVCPGLGPS